MRTFIALELPTYIRQLLQEEQQTLRARLQEEGLQRILGFSRPQNMHLTLRFLGETTDAQVAILAPALSDLAKDHAPFELALTGLGCFPSVKRPSVLWMGVGGQVEVLQELQAAVERQVQSLGFAADKHRFSPHITLARVRRNARSGEVRRLGALLQEELEREGGKGARAAFRPLQVVHFRSDLQAGGPIYTPLTAVSLA